MVAVAVVSWNTRELLRDCLESLRADADAGRAEVWVVDNASSDGSAPMVRSEFPWVRLIALEENLGFGAAVNRAAEGTTAEWIAPANADVALRPGALEALLSAARRNPRAAILAPRLVLTDASTQQSVHPFPGVGSALVFNLGLTRLLPALGRRLALDGFWDPAQPAFVDWAHGAFLLIRRSDFLAAGGFDPSQFLYAEDIDIAWRLRRRGGRVRYVPEAVVDHRHGAAIGQLYGEERDARAQRSAYAWLLRRRGVAVMRSVATLNTLGAGVRALAGALPGRGQAAPGRLAAWQLRRHTRMHLSGLLSSARSLREHR